VKVRDLQESLRASGARPVRMRGSHEIWAWPNGVQVAIVVNHRNADATEAVLRAVKQARRQAGVTVEGER